MRRADRLMQIIQIFRRLRGPVTSDVLARELEVTRRTVYRDIASLIANGVPIRGEAGVGYIMDQGYDLPPLMFTADELEAIMLGARLVATQGDEILARSARDAVAKIATVLPAKLKPVMLDTPLFAPDFGSSEIDQVDSGLIRKALRDQTKLKLHYSDAEQRKTVRTIWPIAMAYHSGIRLLVGFCELRQDFRHFRVDRIETLELTGEKIPERKDQLFHRWWKQDSEKYGDYMLVRSG